ncbi:MAG: SpvB/TcaC N-terminal domain-containing protein, partial [Myxococcota bacterium]
MNSSRPSESPHRITRCRTIGLLVAAALFTPSPSRAQGTAGGFTPAAVDVGPLGSAVVDIPIAVPPGRNGHQPQLSLRYDSRNAANGPLGLGFTLSGQSRIHVCSKQAPFYEDTVSREGFVNQRLCLDGQPLVSDAGTTHSGPAYWTSTRYRTLEESGVRVERKGGSVSCWFSPDCFFHAHRPDGSIAQYGHPVSERFSVRGSTSRKDAWL